MGSGAERAPEESQLSRGAAAEAWSRSRRKEWALAGYITLWMLPLSIGALIIVPLSHSLLILQRQSTLLVWDASRVMAVISVFGVAAYLQLQVRETVLLYSVVMFLF